MRSGSGWRGGAKGDCDLLSHGNDGQPGGSGDAADIGGD
ncbi:MAG: type II secretion system protein GspG [Ramlibacter sp.]|nr:type II secretion system protein GspG [Ramlibacter sp.]